MVEVSGNRDDAVDGQGEGLAVDSARRLGGEGGGGVLVVVELEEAVDGVGVAHHGEDDGVAGVDGYPVDVGKIEAVGAAGGVVDDAKLADGLLRRVEMTGLRGDGERGGQSRKLAAGGGAFLAVVDEGDIAREVGVDVAVNLCRGS